MVEGKILFKRSAEADKSIATTTADGLMSSSDKAKLNEIVENGQGILN